MSLNIRLTPSEALYHILLGRPCILALFAVACSALLMHVCRHCRSFPGSPPFYVSELLCKHEHQMHRVGLPAYSWRPTYYVSQAIIFPDVPASFPPMFDRICLAKCGHWLNSKQILKIWICEGIVVTTQRCAMFRFTLSILLPHSLFHSLSRLLRSKCCVFAVLNETRFRDGCFAESVLSIHMHRADFMFINCSYAFVMSGEDK